jgi:hypothetical protein
MRRYIYLTVALFFGQWTVFGLPQASPSALSSVSTTAPPSTITAGQPITPTVSAIVQVTVFVPAATNGISTEPTNNILSKPSSSNIHPAVICGVVVGLIGLALIVAATWYMIRRSQRKHQLAVDDAEIEKWRTNSPRSNESRGTTETASTRGSTRFATFGAGRRSRIFSAPNAKRGLTDASIPGAPAYIPRVYTRPASRMAKGVARRSTSLTSEPDFHEKPLPAVVTQAPVIPELPIQEDISVNFDRRSVRSYLRF